MKPTREDPLLLLAMDHRASLAKTLYGVGSGEPDDATADRIRLGKRLVYGGLDLARKSLSGGTPGVLVDERYGSDVIAAVHASTDPPVLALPIEHSGQEWFGLEWGGLGDTEWTDHVAAAKPAYAKVLVRDNPSFSDHHRHAQLTHLKTAFDLLTEMDVPLLYELLVPPTDAQSSDAYDRDVRPELVTKVIADNYAAGIEPALWKIEGLETADAARLVVSAAKADGRTADCIVLGRDAPRETLDHWLEIAAPVEGFVGFAIGRSIWEDALKAFTEGSLPQDEVAVRVAENYLHFAETYLSHR